jgi:hypothetical protein
MADLQWLIECAEFLEDGREQVSGREDALRMAINQYLDENLGAANDLARRLKFTPTYICDIRHGRRTISPEFVERLKKVKP